MRVKATREGLLGKTTASGYIIDTVVPFVALPAHDALGKLVKLTSAVNGKSCYAFVLDVGPWLTADNAYVFRGARPLAEVGYYTIIMHGKPLVVQDVNKNIVNGAGIDLGQRVWNELGMSDNGQVDWEFVE